MVTTTGPGYFFLFFKEMIPPSSLAYGYLVSDCFPTMTEDLWYHALKFLDKYRLVTNRFKYSKYELMTPSIPN